jgi:hypothetical protein
MTGHPNLSSTWARSQATYHQCSMDTIISPNERHLVPNMMLLLLITPMSLYYLIFDYLIFDLLLKPNNLFYESSYLQNCNQDNSEMC